MGVVRMEDVGVIRDNRWILADITWTVGAGEHWVVIGPNGAGKSTLVAVATARLFPSRGDVWITGHQVGAVHLDDVRASLGCVSAGDAALIPEDESVLDVVLTAAHGIRGRWRETYEAMDVERARLLLTETDMAHLGTRTFGTLSDGERQRVLLARARMTDPEVLVLDEPSSGLDLAAREHLLSDLESMARDPHGPSSVTVTHHLEEIPATTTHALVLREGRVIAQGPIRESLTESSVSAAYALPVRLAERRGRWQVTR